MTSYAERTAQRDAATAAALEAYSAELDAHGTDLDRLDVNACQCGRAFPTAIGRGLHIAKARKAAAKAFAEATRAAGEAWLAGTLEATR